MIGIEVASSSGHGAFLGAAQNANKEQSTGPEAAVACGRLRRGRPGSGMISKQQVVTRDARLGMMRIT
jgi:hypothetical protein